MLAKAGPNGDPIATPSTIYVKNDVLVFFKQITKIMLVIF